MAVAIHLPCSKIACFRESRLRSCSLFLVATAAAASTDGKKPNQNVNERTKRSGVENSVCQSENLKKK